MTRTTSAPITSFSTSIAALLICVLCWFDVELSVKVLGIALIIVGGYGMAREYRVSWLKSYADLFFTGEGSANVQKILIAEDALGYKIADRHHGKTGLRDVLK